MIGCAFCDTDSLADRLIAQNDVARVFPTNAPIVAGHILIAPKRHAQYFEELTHEERTGIETLRMQMHAGLKNVFGAEGFNYAWNEEMIGGQSVPHFHLHMLPRKEGDEGVYQYEPREFIYRSVPIGQRAKSSSEELQRVAQLIRAAL